MQMQMARMGLSGMAGDELAVAQQGGDEERDGWTRLGMVWSLR